MYYSGVHITGSNSVLQNDNMVTLIPANYVNKGKLNTMQLQFGNIVVFPELQQDTARKREEVTHQPPERS